MAIALPSDFSHWSTVRTYFDRLLNILFTNSLLLSLLRAIGLRVMSIKKVKNSWGYLAPLNH